MGGGGRHGDWEQLLGTPRRQSVQHHLHCPVYDSALTAGVGQRPDQHAHVIPRCIRAHLAGLLTPREQHLDGIPQYRSCGLYLVGGARRISGLFQQRDERELGRCTRDHLRNWDVEVVLYWGSASFKTILEPAGLGAVTGSYTPAWLKDPADPQWKADEGVQRYRDVVENCGTDADPEQAPIANGYAAAQAVVQVLESLGEKDITGEAINQSWSALTSGSGDVLMPGATLAAGGSGRLVHEYQMQRVNGETWAPVVPIADIRQLGIAD